MSASGFVFRSVFVSSLIALSMTQANADVADAVKPIATPEPVQGFVVKTPNFAFQPFAQLQAWGTYSRDRQAQLNTTTDLENVDDRANFFFRRARVGIRGVPYQRLNYTLSLFYDNVGHDSLSNTRNLTNPATGTGANAGRQNDVTRSGTVVGVWDAFLTWKMSETSDLAHVTFGYFRPQISRESLTPAFSVNSFEKAISQNYVRQAVIGRGFGRGVGINLGGLVKREGWGTRYNVGVFNRTTTGDTVSTGTPPASGTFGETQGNKNSLVSVARAEVYFGDPEMEKYGLGIQSNFFGRRNGITLAINGSHQDRTPNYFGSRNIGADILWNYRYLTLELEGFLLDYKSNTSPRDVTAKTGLARVGYSFPLKNGTYLEPAAMISGYFGEDQSEFTGRDVVIDGGLNWYLDENRYKFYLHYTHQDAEGGPGAGNLGNRPGTFSYGDYYGLGLTLQI